MTAVATTNAVAAGVGAVGLASGWLAMSETAQARLPWGSVILAGGALALTVALPNAALAVLAARRDPRWGAASFAVGAVLVAWILVELAFIRELSFFHPFYAGVGLLLCWLGARHERATNEKMSIEEDSPASV